MAEISQMLKNRTSKNIWKGVNPICCRKTSARDKFKLVDSASGISLDEDPCCSNLYGCAIKFVFVLKKIMVDPVALRWFLELVLRIECNYYLLLLS